GSDEFESELRARDSCAAETAEGIHDGADAREAMEPQALLGKPRREGRRMRTVSIAPLDRVVGNEPRVAAASDAVARGAPARDVRLILVWNAERKAVDVGLALEREVEYEFVAVVQEAVAVDRLVMPDGQISRQTRAHAGKLSLDGDRFHPMYDVLERQ